MLKQLQQIDALGRATDGLYTQPTLAAARSAAYDGYLCYVEETQKVYLFKKNGSTFAESIVYDRTQTEIDNAGQTAEGLANNVAELQTYVGNIQYELSQARGNNLTLEQRIATDLNTKADTQHSHQQNEITGLSTDLNNIRTDIAGKAAAAHTHTVADISGDGGENTLANRLNKINSDIAGKAAASHTHLFTEIFNQSEVNESRVNLATRLANIDSAHNSVANRVTTAEGQISDIQSTLNTLTGSGNESSLTSQIAHRGQNLEQIIDQLTYSPRAISALTLNPATVEKGSMVTEITASWTTTGTSAINNIALSVGGNSHSCAATDTQKTISNISLTAQTNIVLTITTVEADCTTPKNVSKTATLYFRRRLFYGNVTTQFATSAAVRAAVGNTLTQVWETQGTISFTNVGSGVTLIVPQGKTITSAITGNNENITSAFATAAYTVDVEYSDGTTETYNAFVFAPQMAMQTSLTIKIS